MSGNTIHPTFAQTYASLEGMIYPARAVERGKKVIGKKILGKSRALEVASGAGIRTHRLVEYDIPKTYNRVLGRKYKGSRGEKKVG